MTIQQKLNKVVERLKPYKPTKVILYGSQVRGEAREDSDIDLLIIKETKKNHYQRIPEARKYLFSIDSPFDILVLTPHEIKKRLILRDFFIEDIINNGRVLYEAE